MRLICRRRLLLLQRNYDGIMSKGGMSSDDYLFSENIYLLQNRSDYMAVVNAEINACIVLYISRA